MMIDKDKLLEALEQDYEDAKGRPDFEDFERGFDYAMNIVKEFQKNDSEYCHVMPVREAVENIGYLELKGVKEIHKTKCFFDPTYTDGKNIVLLYLDGDNPGKEGIRTSKDSYGYWWRMWTKEPTTTDRACLTWWGGKM